MNMSTKIMKIQKSNIEIKGHLYLNKTSPKQIAKELKCTPASISRILSGQSKSKRIAGFIAKTIGRKREEIFGY